MGKWRIIICKLLPCKKNVIFKRVKFNSRNCQELVDSLISLWLCKDLQFWSAKRQLLARLNSFSYQVAKSWNALLACSNLMQYLKLNLSVLLWYNTSIKGPGLSLVFSTKKSPGKPNKCNGIVIPYQVDRIHFYFLFWSPSTCPIRLNCYRQLKACGQERPLLVFWPFLKALKNSWIVACGFVLPKKHCSAVFFC